VWLHQRNVGSLWYTLLSNISSKLTPSQAKERKRWMQLKIPRTATHLNASCRPSETHLIKLEQHPNQLSPKLLECLVYRRTKNISTSHAMPPIQQNLLATFLVLEFCSSMASERQYRFPDSFFFLRLRHLLLIQDKRLGSIGLEAVATTTLATLTAQHQKE
jgi:hypothetical protein